MTGESFINYMAAKIAANRAKAAQFEQNKESEMARISKAFEQASTAAPDKYGIISRWALDDDARTQALIAVKPDGTMCLLKMDLKDESVVELDRLPWDEKDEYSGL